MPFRINGLIQFTEAIHQELEALTNDASDLSSNEKHLAALRERIIKSNRQVKATCDKHHANPADLPNPSFQAYLWLKFLENRQWLLTHFYALKEFQQFSQAALDRKVIALRHPILKVRIRYFNYLFRVKQNKNQVLLEINEGFINAPKAIKSTLVSCALERRTRVRLEAIKAYTQGDDYRRISMALKADGAQNRQTHKGKCFDLEELFDSLNQEYFKGQLKRTRLTWSAKSSRRRLGYYNPDTGAITISRILDHPSIPPLLVNYILYHEMLHHALGIRESNGRRYAHTAKFKKSEQQYDGYEEALKLMRLFSNKSL